MFSDDTDTNDDAILHHFKDEVFLQLQPNQVWVALSMVIQALYITESRGPEREEPSKTHFWLSLKAA